MLTVPPFVWRAGVVSQALAAGVAIGLFLGALAWLDSGIPLAAVVVFVSMGTAYGIWMGRRMVRYWPGAGRLTGAQRELVVRTTRSGGAVEEPAVAAGVIEYRDGLRAAVENAYPFRWLVGLVLVVALGFALWDVVAGSARDVVASCVYLGLLLFEVFWWPGRRDRLLANADRAAQSAQDVIDDGFAA